MRFINTGIDHAITIFALLFLAACSGGGSTGGTTSTSGATPANTYAVGGSITGLNASGLVLLNNGGDNFTVPINSTNFTFATHLASGAGYGVTVLTQPASQTCTIGKGTGTINGGNVNTVAVSCTVNITKHYAYVTNGLYAYAINSSSGALTAVPGTPLLGAGSGNLTIHPSGKFAYMVGCSSIKAYAVDASTGALTDVPGSPFKAGLCPQYVTIDPTGKFAFVTNSSVEESNIFVYTINASTGALVQVSGSPFAAAAPQPFRTIIDPSGKFAYVSHVGGGVISAYKINSVTGALTAVPGSPFVGGVLPIILTSGKFLYTLAYSETTHSTGPIIAYAINASTGALSEVSRSPSTIGSHLFPFKIDPLDRFIYVPASGIDGIYAYAINANTGVLTAVPGSPFLAGQTIDYPELVVHPSGKFAYMTSAYSILSYTINVSTGALTAVPSSAPGAQSLSVDSTGKFLYTVGSNLAAYTIDANSGALTTIPGSPFYSGYDATFNWMNITVH